MANRRLADIIASTETVKPRYRCTSGRFDFLPPPQATKTRTPTRFTTLAPPGICLAPPITSLRSTTAPERYNAAILVLDRGLRNAPEHLKCQMERLGVQMNLATLNRQRGKPQEAEALFLSVISTSDRLAQMHPTEPPLRVTSSAANNNLSILYQRAGKLSSPTCTLAGRASERRPFPRAAGKQAISLPRGCILRQLGRFGGRAKPERAGRFVVFSGGHPV